MKKFLVLLLFVVTFFTVEAGAEHFEHPLQDDGLENILERNSYALYDLSAAVAKL